MQKISELPCDGRQRVASRSYVFKGVEAKLHWFIEAVHIILRLSALDLTSWDPISAV